MRSVGQTFIAIALSILSTLSYAVTVDNLSDVDIAVQNQSRTERQIAFKNGLKQVIFKHVGDDSVYSNSEIEVALRSPSNLMNQFSYFENGDQLYLKAQFSESKIIELLRRAGVPIWGKNRPLTITWIAFDDGEFNAIESDSSDNNFITSLKNEAEKVALPIVLPIMDFDEATSVSMSDIKGSFVNQIHTLNQRYGVEYYSLINIEKRGDNYQFELQLFPQNQEGVLRPVYQYKGATKQLNVLVSDIVKPLANYFAKEYSVSANNQSSKVTLEFIDVDSLATAIDIERYVNSLTTVKSAHISGLKNNTLAITLDLYGDETDMLKLLKLDPKIKAVESDFEDESTIKQQYTWQ